MGHLRWYLQEVGTNDMTREKLLIFDFNNLLHRSIHAYAGLSHEGVPTSGIFGFIVIFCHQINLHRPDKVLVCTDSPPYSRKDLFPEYKEDRKPLEEDMKIILKMNGGFCEDFLDLLGVTLWKEEGQEADDLIAIAADEHSSEGKEIVIVSNDDDLFTLFKYPRITLQRGKNTYTREMYLAEYPNMSAKKWVEVQAMAGSHNGVPGVKGIGVKTAIKILDHPDKITDNIKQKVADNKDRIELFKKIIKLPYDPSIEPCEITTADFDLRDVINKVAEWGITFQNNFSEAIESLK